VSILKTAKYYEKHVLAYKNAPSVKEAARRYLDDSINRNLRLRSVGDLRYRLNCFAAEFGEMRLSEITLDELKEWVQDDGWGMRTRVNFLTKISQLYRFAILNRWVDSNLTEQIARPTVDETGVEIFGVDETERLLNSAQQFDLLAYIAIGFFAGVRSAKMVRLNGRSINFGEKTITIGADIAKKRSQRIVVMQPALLAWLQPCKDALQAAGPVVDQKTFRKDKERLLEAAKIQEWRANGLRHSFGTYHYALFRSAEDTSHQMGNSVEVVHKHYKALVPKADAEKFWNLRPAAETPNPVPSSVDYSSAHGASSGASSGKPLSSPEASTEPVDP
jgi:integrase